MRISDWSSDGCSSDLRMNHKRPSRPIAAAALAMTALVLAACGDDEEPTADPTTTEAETTTTEEATTTTEPELSEEEAVVKAYVEHWPAFYAFLNGTPPGDPADYFTGDRLADLPGSIRSEEHTSELQSLMRISYAVFCLKKKKHTQID